MMQKAGEEGVTTLYCVINNKHTPASSTVADEVTHRQSASSISAVVGVNDSFVRVSVEYFSRLQGESQTN